MAPDLIKVFSAFSSEALKDAEGGKTDIMSYKLVANIVFKDYILDLSPCYMDIYQSDDLSKLMIEFDYGGYYLKHIHYPELIDDARKYEFCPNCNCNTCKPFDNSMTMLRAMEVIVKVCGGSYTSLNIPIKLKLGFVGPNSMIWSPIASFWTFDHENKIVNMNFVIPMEIEFTIGFIGDFVKNEGISRINQGYCLTCSCVKCSQKRREWYRKREQQLIREQQEEQEQRRREEARENYGITIYSTPVKKRWFD